MAVFENRQPVTAAKFIIKGSLLVLLLGVIRRLELKPISEQKLGIYSSPRHMRQAMLHTVIVALSSAVCYNSYLMPKNPLHLVVWSSRVLCR